MIYLSLLCSQDEKLKSDLQNQDTIKFKEFILEYQKEKEAELLRKASIEAENKHALLVKETTISNKAKEKAKGNLVGPSTTSKSNGTAKQKNNKSVAKQITKSVEVSSIDSVSSDEYIGIARQ